MRTPGTGAAGSKRVYLHVGAPKTGTTFLQQVLAKNQSLLAEHAVLYPYEAQGESRSAMLDFRKLGRGGSRKHAGAWERIAGRVRAWEGSTAIVSHELLGGADAASIEAGVAALQPADVHVVFSARDLARQLVSDWQEQVKHKHTVTLERFVDDLVALGIDAPAPFGPMFWGLHDAAHVLDRWAGVVGPRNVHLVTVPQPGAPEDTLWRRFCAVTGLDPGAYDTAVERSNSSMGVAETELVRRLNTEVREVPGKHYDRIVRIELAENILGRRSPKLELPPRHADWVQERSRQLVADLARCDYDVVGDLRDLLPGADVGAGHVSPTTLSDADLAGAALRSVAGLVEYSARQRQRIAELEERLEALERVAPEQRSAGVLGRNLHRLYRGRDGHVPAPRDRRVQGPRVVGSARPSPA